MADIRETELEITDFEKEYLKNQAIKNRYTNSPAILKQEEEDNDNDELGKLVEADNQAKEDNAPGLFDYIAGFSKHIGVGVAKGFEETGQTVGLLKDDAWNLPEPTNIVESLGQGIGQFMPMFVGGAGLLRGGLKLANLMQKGGKLSTAGRNLTAIGAGAFSDVVAFDPKDQNMGNLALSIGAISNSPRTSAFIREYLAQDDSDSEAKARMKNALTGMVAGAIVEGLIRGAGYSYRKIKSQGKPKETPEIDTNIYGDEDFGIEPIPTTTTRGTRGVTRKVEYEPQDEFGPSPRELKEAEEAAEEIAPDIVEQIIDPLKGLPRELDQVFPNKEAAAVAELNTNYVSDIWENLKTEDSRFTEEVIDRITDFASGRGLPIQEMSVTKTFTKPDGTKVTKKVPLIESVNFLKLNTEAEMQNALQFFAKAFDIKKLAKPTTKNQDLETVLQDLLDPFYGDDLDAMDQVIDNIGKKAANVDEAIRYVGSAKFLHRLSIDNMNKQSLKAGKTGLPEDHKLLEELIKRDEMLHRASGLLSYKSGQLLRAHQPTIIPKKDQALLAAELVKDVFKATGKITTRGHRNYQKLLNQDKHKINEIIDEGKLTEKIELTTDKGQAGGYKTKRTTTVTAGETPSGKPRAERIKKAKNVIRTIKQRVASKIKGKEKYVASLKRPERGEPRPKLPPLPDNAKLKALDEEIAKVKADRDTLDNKFKKQAKEQLKYRKEFETISSKIKALREGGVPLKKKTGQPLKPTEIADLNAQYKRELKKAKDKMSQAQKDQLEIDKLSEQHTKLLLKRIEKDPTITQTTKSGDINPVIKELKEAVKREETILKERVTRKELEETLISKTKGEIYKEVNDMNLRQLRTRVASLKKSTGAKTKDAMLEIYINGLLSSFKTWGSVNPIGNTSAFTSTVIERAFAGATGDQIAMRESVELAWNFISGMPDAFRTFLSAMKSGTSDWNVKFDLTNPNERMISKEAFNVGGNLGKVIDFIGMIVNLPGKILISQDEAFKGLVIRGEQRALAWRKARNKFSDKDLRSPEIKAKIQQEFDDIVSDFSKHEDITEAAKETANKNSFTNDLPDRIVTDGRTGKEKNVPGFSKTVQQALDRHNFIKVFVPFFRTPVNILNFTWERTPILQFANKNLRRELTSSNKAIKQLAMARVGTSMAITTAMFGLALSGNFTGAPPRDRRLRTNMELAMGGNHWYSFNFGGGWKSYDRYDPYGILMASSAAMATMGKSMISIKEKINETGDPTGELQEKYNEVINSTIVGTAEMIKNRHYIQGISEFISFLSGDARGLTPSFKRLAMVADPRIGFYSSLRRAVTRGTRTAKPRKLQRGVGVTGEQDFFSDIIEEISLAHDEALRDVVAGYGKISPEKDLVGNIVSYPGTDGEFDTIHNLYNTAITPSPSLVPSKSPLIRKLAELESNVEQPSSIKKMGNVVLSEEEKDFIIDKWTNLNKRVAEPLINTSMFKNSGAGLQKLLLETLIRKNKEAAKWAALTKFDRLKDSFADYKINQEQRKGTSQPTQGFQPPELFNLQQQPQGQ